MNETERAVSCFKEGFNCCQSVLQAFAPELGVDRETALRLAAGFGGGMGRMAGTCGVVTGAYMVLGLKYAKASADPADKEKMHVMIREFAQRFKETHGSLECRDLLGCDISTPEGFALSKERDLHATLCAKLVEDSAIFLKQLLAEHR